MKDFRFFGIYFFLALFLFGCSHEKGLPTREKILRVPALAEVETLDPQKILFLADLRVASFIFEGLVALDARQKPVPLLAEKWEKLDGGRRIRFQIRKNVRFQDDPCFPDGVGRLVTASDVQYTFERLADPAVRSPNAYLFEGKIVGFSAFRSGRASHIAGIRVLSKNQIEFRLTKPYFSFLTLLSTHATRIVPREALAAYGDNFGQHPVGTGPFRLARWKPLSEILLVKNTHYWRRDASGKPLPRLDGLQISLNSNPVLSMSDFLKGNLDVLLVSAEDLRKLRKEPDFPRHFQVVKKMPAAAVRFFGFSLDKQTVLGRDTRLRRAVVQAFPRAQLSENSEITKNPAQSLVPPFLFQMPHSRWPAFSRKAARRTAQRIWPESKTVTVSSNVKTADVELLCQTLRDLGFRCVLDIHPVKYYAHILRQRPDIFRVSFVPNYPDPEDYYALFWSKNIGNTNLTGYHNSQFDALFEKVLVEQSSEARRQLFFQLEEILARDIPAIYLMESPPSTVVAARSVHSVGVGLSGLNLTETFLEK